MSELSLPSFSVPLISALESLQGWITRENEVRAIAATASLREFRKATCLPMCR